MPKISYDLPLRWYLGYLSVWMLAVDKRLCLLWWVHYICDVQRVAKMRVKSPNFQTWFPIGDPFG